MEVCGRQRQANATVDPAGMKDFVSTNRITEAYNSVCMESIDMHVLISLIPLSASCQSAISLDEGITVLPLISSSPSFYPGLRSTACSPLSSPTPSQPRPSAGPEP